MSSSTKGRVVRRNIPTETITADNHRKFWTNLDADFESRCAYSMQHTYRAGGERCMEIDHFNPTKRYDRTQSYHNLFLSTRHCNVSGR